MTAPSSATFGEWNETSIANDGADDGGAAVATDADYAGSAAAACYGADAGEEDVSRVARRAPVSDDGATGPGFAETFVAYPPDRYVASCVEFKSSSRLQCRVRERRRHARPAGPVSGDDDLTTTAASAAPSPGLTAAPAAANGNGGERDGRARRSTESVDYAAAFNADETNGATFCAAVRLAAPSATGVEGCAAGGTRARHEPPRPLRTYAVVFDTSPSTTSTSSSTRRWPP
ncbi:hypothetical protein JL721_9223 [Aureococcus anophagefferens]|nr:hypothetical protein JL721_9223 [Aureococcus anophagefferens]